MSIEIDGKSLDVKAQKLDQLKEIFPEFFSEGKIDLKRIKELLTDEEIATPDRYELSWAGKAEARKEIQKQTSATLIPDKEGSINFDTTDNIFIEGENLEVLRVLQKSYFGKVKMIFIDPPYNTGNDSFIYPDDFAERTREYEKRTGTRNGEGYLNKLDLYKKNTKENGQYHSVWLSMMYPRLYLSRNLLREDGVIFISIDDNEVGNLRLLMDEIFGSENFVANVVWQKKYATANDAKGFSAMHDHIIVYQKSNLFERNLFPRTEKQDVLYKNDNEDGRGRWRTDNLLVKSYSESYVFPIKNPKTGEEFFPPKGSCWRASKETIGKWITENRIFFGKEGTGRPQLKRYLNEVQQGTVPSTWWQFSDFGHNDEANKELKSIFEEKSPFDTPKPTRLLKKIMQVGTNANEHHIVLDFFAGSGTTAHALLDLNEEDGGNRSFICIQMPELCEEEGEAYKSGYKSIADICKTRIKKVIERIHHKDNGKIEYFKSIQNMGFRSYKLSYSNFKKWKSDVENKEVLLKQLEMFKEPLAHKPNDTYVLLVELLVKSGFALSVKVERKNSSDGIPYFLVDNGQLIFALNKVSQKLLDEIQTMKPKTFVVLGNLFEGEKADEMLNNWKLQLNEFEITFKII